MRLFNKQKGLCALSGIEMTKVAGKGMIQTNASIDRIKPGSAYEPGKIRLVCTLINGFRGNATDKEFLWWINKIAEHNLS